MTLPSLLEYSVLYHTSPDVTRLQDYPTVSLAVINGFASATICQSFSGTQVGNA